MYIRFRGLIPTISKHRKVMQGMCGAFIIIHFRVNIGHFPEFKLMYHLGGSCLPVSRSVNALISYPCLVLSSLYLHYDISKTKWERTRQETKPDTSKKLLARKKKSQQIN